MWPPLWQPCLPKIGRGDPDILVAITFSINLSRFQICQRCLKSRADYNVVHAAYGILK